jgi:NADH-quinone oxidoreductase subunit C
MTHIEMADMLQSHFPGVRVTPKYSNQLEVLAEAGSIASLLAVMKSLGFEHLSNITCVDWLSHNRFDVTYNVWSYAHRVHAVVKVSVVRNEPEVPTVLNVWPQAQPYEREIHEMFGVRFTGNPDLSPLFLHNWKDIPPLRKDFDTVEYARRAYGVGGNEGDRNHE